MWEQGLPMFTDDFIKNSLAMFSKALKSEIDKIISIKQKPMDPLTRQEIIAHNNAKTCFILRKSLC